MTGVITAVIRKSAERRGGFGFLRDEEGKDRFFHANNLRGITFDKVEEGQAVEFKPIATPQGLRADRILVLNYVE